MGLGDLIDGIGDAVEGGFNDVVNGAKHVVGTAVDDGAHVLGDGLNAVGLHGAAQAVDNFGDSAADHLGDQVAEQQLGQTTDPTQLVHGDLHAIQTAAARLANFGSAFHETAQGLAGIDTTHWQGQAADAFRAHYHQHPQQWGITADACTTAASAWNTYGDAVLAAQQQAQKAITLYQQGTQATAQAQARYNQAVATFTQQANAYNAAAAQGQDPGPMPQAPAAFSDPGAAARTQAQQILTTARQQRDAAGDQAQQAITHAASTFPAVPAFTQRIADDASDTLTTAAVEGEHLVGGVAKGVGSMVKFVRGVDPLDPYNVTHPADYIDHMSQTAAGLVHVALHPQQLVTGLVGTEWGSDPAEALGRLIPNLVATVATDGAGAAADGAEAGMGAATAAEAAGITGRTAAGIGDDTAADASTAAQATAQADHGALDPGLNQTSAGLGIPVEGEPSAGWGDFGPSGSPDLGAADARAVGSVDSAGAGLGDFERDINGVHAHATTTAPSASNDTTIVSAAHNPPRLPDGPSSTSVDVNGIRSRLSGVEPPPAPSIGDADAAVARTIDDAAGGLGQAENDLAQIHVHQPQGPAYNPSEYSAPGYEADGATRNAYLDRYPSTPQDRVFLHNTRESWPAARDLSDPELLAIGRLTTPEIAEINGPLRAGDQAAIADQDLVIRNAVSGLNKIRPPFEGKVFRGIGIKDEDLPTFLERYKKGEQVSEPAFTHSSMERPYGNNRNVVFTIDSHEGKDISSLLYGQGEVIFPPGEKFTVTDVRYDPGDQRWYIRLNDDGR